MYAFATSGAALHDNIKQPNAAANEKYGSPPLTLVSTSHLVDAIYAVYFTTVPSNISLAVHVTHLQTTKHGCSINKQLPEVCELQHAATKIKVRCYTGVYMMLTSQKVDADHQLQTADENGLTNSLLNRTGPPPRSGANSINSTQ